MDKVNSVGEHYKVIGNLIEKYFGNDQEVSFLEIGVASGKTPTYLLNRFNNIKYTGIDQKIAEELNKLKPRCTFIQGRSDEVYKNIGNNSFDFIYIDGGHSYLQCLYDILHYLPKAKKRSIFGGHDLHEYDSPESGVREAVEKIFGTVNYSCTGTWWIAKDDVVVEGSRDDYHLNIYGIEEKILVQGEDTNIKL